MHVRHWKMLRGKLFGALDLLVQSLVSNDLCLDYSRNFLEVSSLDFHRLGSFLAVDSDLSRVRAYQHDKVQSRNLYPLYAMALRRLQ